jgi:hypothetical protein
MWHAITDKWTADKQTCSQLNTYANQLKGGGGVLTVFGGTAAAGGERGT